MYTTILILLSNHEYLGNVYLPKLITLIVRGDMIKQSEHHLSPQRGNIKKYLQQQPLSYPLLHYST